LQFARRRLSPPQILPGSGLKGEEEEKIIMYFHSPDMKKLTFAGVVFGERERERERDCRYGSVREEMCLTF